MLFFVAITSPFAISIMDMFFFTTNIAVTIPHKLYAVNISLIINVYDCGAVTGNGLLGNGLRGKTVIFFRRSFRFRTCFALLGFSFLQRIAVVICIFLPMENSILCIGTFCPLCSDRSCAGNRCNRVAVCVIPTVKRVAVAGGGDCAQVKCFHPELRCHVVAAVGIKRDPETGFNYRVNVCNAGCKCDGFVGGIVARRDAPADNAFFFVHGELNLSGRGVQICFRNVFTGYARGGVINHLCTVFIHEVYVAVRLKLRRKFYGRTAGYGSNFAKAFKEVAVFIVPPNKTCIVFFGCSRLEELFAFGDGLRPIGQLRTVVIKAIGIDLGLLVVRTQHSHCNARFRALFRRCSFLCTCGGGRLCFHFNGSRGLYRGGSRCLLRSGSGCLLRSCGLLGRRRLVNDRRSPLHNIPCCSVGVRFLITHCKRARRTCRNQHTCAQQHGDDLLFHSVFLQSCDLSVL